MKIFANNGWISNSDDPYNPNPDFTLKNTYYYYKIKICYDEIPLGFYCNDSEHNILDKLPQNSKEFEREDIDKCSENSPYLYNNNSCIKECSAMDFLNHICKISNSNLNIKHNS